MEPPKTLVLGMGNPILSDDAIGCRLVADLRRALPPGPGLDFVAECSVGGLNLIDVLAGYARVVVVDAVRTTGGRPGDWFEFTAADLRGTRHLSSVHDVNFATALELGRRLGRVLPRDEDVHVIAVEIAAAATFGEELTPPLAARYVALSAEVTARARELLAG